MGLDCIPMGRAKPEHAEEWAELMEKFCEGNLNEDEEKRWLEISIPAYACVGAPCVGRDKAADDYVLKNKPKDSSESNAEFLAKLGGYFVLDLVENCDGVPRYTLGALSHDVDQTSFRGQMLTGCYRVIGDRHVIAWTDMRPEEAIEFGQELLAAAEKARRGDLEPEEPKPEEATGKRRLFGLLKPKPIAPSFELQRWEKRQRSKISVEEQIALVEAAGRWYLFWGRLGHPIHAYF